MSESFEVETEQIRTHARDLDALWERFGAVKAASGHISRNDEAYGLLCGWISRVLEGRHIRQDELIAYVAENLTIAAEALRKAADEYDTVDTDASDRLRAVESRLRL
jgi:Excreted virulence factor EspC, type VII ESX diderm